jgi:tubulin polyglutamylase TTLL6/13
MLLQVNRSPDLHTSTAIDKIVKRQLLTDTFKLLQLDKSYKNAAFTEQKWITRQRALKAEKDVL